MTVTDQRIRDIALETASASLSNEMGAPESIKDEIAPAVAFLSMHCKEAVIEMLSTRFKPEVIAVDNEAVIDLEAKGYNQAIIDIIEFLGDR